MFLVLCNEAFGYTHEQTLNSSLVLLLAMLREHGYVANERNKTLYPEENSDGDDSGDWVEAIDFETGKAKKVRKSRSV